MRLALLATTRFEKDLKRVRKQGKNLDKLESVVDLLQAQQPLPLSCHAHCSRGTRADHWDCHIEPDWLLLYRVTEASLILVRTGSHVELFE